MMEMLITFLSISIFFPATVWGTVPQVSKTIKMALGKDLTISISEISQRLKWAWVDFGYP